SLNEVYRQKEGSKIIHLAHEIKHDTCTMETRQKDRDFSFLPCKEHQLLEVMTTVFVKAIKKGIDPGDIQVLAQIYRTQSGINRINQQLQQLINPPKPGKREVAVHDSVYRAGDRVIQLINQPEEGIFNGDIGEVAAIFEEDEKGGNPQQLVVSFDG